MNDIPLLSQPYVNEVTLREQKWPLKGCQSLNFFYIYLFQKFSSFNPVNIRSVDQRAAKLLSVKLWEIFDPGSSWTWADWFQWGQTADFFLRPQILTASNFQALWPTDPIFTALKDLNFLNKWTKNQEDDTISRVIFPLSKRPHLHRVYLITFLFWML